MSKKKFAVVLAGCGVYDGAEIHEATMTLLAIMQNGGEYQIFAPDIPQYHVVNHLTGEEMKGESRNVLVEAARIARGNIKELSEYKPEDFDALIFPGGFGVAKNFSDFYFKGANSTVIPPVKKAILDTVAAGKPIGALCISPAIVARVLEGAIVTIGNDEATAKEIEKMGATHMVTQHGQVTIDEKYKVFTTPCYMLNATILDIYEDASAVVKEIFRYLDGE